MGKKLTLVTCTPFLCDFVPHWFGQFLGLHDIVWVREESLGIQVHHSLVVFILTTEPICLVFWGKSCLYLFQIFWNIFVLLDESVSQTSVSHVPP